MLNKINKEIDDFTNTIKEVKGCDEMLTYMNSNIYASIKLLIFASKTFSLYIRMMLFFVIASASLLVSTIIGALPGSITLFLATTLFLFLLILLYVLTYKKKLFLSIEKSKKLMK